MMLNKELKLKFETAFESLLLEYPQIAHASIVRDKSKYFEELQVINYSMGQLKRRDTRLSLLDVGGGAGNLCLLLKNIFDFDVYMVDRMDEFDEHHQRVMGDDDGIKKRLNRAKIDVQAIDPFAADFHLDRTFDFVVNFDVIEHLSYGVPQFISKLYERVSDDGFLILSTPNQCHAQNRIKALMGYNTWEDFNYYITADRFFGHIRELTFSEMKFLMRHFPNSRLLGRTHQLNKYGRLNRFPHFINKFFKYMLDIGCPTLSYQIFSVTKK